MAPPSYELDRAGRYKKTYRPRVHPDIKWREEDFVKKYRLCTARVKRLSAEFGQYSKISGTTVGGGISHFQQMCLAIRYFAMGLIYSVIAETQEVSGATVCRCVEYVSDFFHRFSNSYIKWPETTVEKVKIAEGFARAKRGRPCIIGCVVDMHIAIISPAKGSEAAFVNRKGYYSLNTMIVCDSRQYITHINPCWAGSANDQYCFSQSELYDEAEQGAWEEMFLLGDSGYTQKPYLFRPYDVPATPQQRRFNRWHGKTRCLVERTIGVLKQRWRCLDASGGYLHHDPVRAVKIVITCAALHNLAVHDRTPNRENEDNGHDRFRRRREPPKQPRDYIPDQNEDARDLYARTHFRYHEPKSPVPERHGRRWTL